MVRSRFASLTKFGPKFGHIFVAGPNSGPKFWRAILGSLNRKGLNKKAAAAANGQCLALYADESDDTAKE